MTNSYRPGLKKFDWFKAGLEIPIQPGTFHTARDIPYSPGCPAPMFAESVHRVNTTAQTMWFLEGVAEFRPENQLLLKNEEDI